MHVKSGIDYHGLIMLINFFLEVIYCIFGYYDGQGEYIFIKFIFFIIKFLHCLKIYCMIATGNDQDINKTEQLY